MEVPSSGLPTRKKNFIKLLANFPCFCLHVKFLVNRLPLLHLCTVTSLILQLSSVTIIELGTGKYFPSSHTSPISPMDCDSLKIITILTGIVAEVTQLIKQHLFTL